MNHRINMQRLPLAILLALALPALWSLATAGTDPVSKSRSDKADYLFLEAQNAYQNNEFDRYIQLVRHAYATDSTDIDIAGEWAFMVLADDNTDEVTAEKAYNLLKKRFFERPTNYYNGVMFANIAIQQTRFDDAVATWQMLDSLFPKRSEPAEELAQVYLRSYVYGDSTAFDKAMQIYNDIERRKGKDVSVISMKIKAYAFKSDTLAIIGELEALDSVSPNDSYVALSIGLYYDYLDKKELALKYLDRACELDSTNGQAYAARADYHKEAGDTTAYDREVFHALRSVNLDPASKISMLRSYVVDLYQDSTQEQRIRNIFNDLQVMHPDEAEIHTLFASYLYLREDLRGAAEQYSYAADVAPNDENIRSGLIQITFAAGDTAKAISLAHEAMDRFPHNLYYPLLLSSHLLEQADTAGAIAILDSVKIDEVHNVQAVSRFLASKGDILANAGDTARALETYDEALTIDPNNNMALNNAAYFMAISGGDLDKAERYSMRSLKGDELNTTYLDTYAWVQFLKKNYLQAKIYIDVALNAYGDRIENLQPHSTEIEIVDDHDITSDIDIYTDDSIAIAADTIFDEDNPSGSIISADILDHAGDIYFMNGDKDKAVYFWGKALILDPENALIRRKYDNKTIFM